MYKNIGSSGGKVREDILKPFKMIEEVTHYKTTYQRGCDRSYDKRTVK